MRSPLLLSFVVFAACSGAQHEVKPDLQASSSANREGSTQDLFSRGVASLDAGRLDEAKATLSQVAARAPRSVVVQFDLGVLAERQGKLAEAIGAYEAAHAIDPRHKPTLLNLGRAYRLQERYADAIALYEDALKDGASEYDVELNNNLSVAYRLAKKFDRAEATARKVLSRSKENADAYKNLALIYFDQGNYRLAEFICDNARKLDDKDPGVYNNLGLISLKLDDRRAALAQFQKAVALDKDFAPSLFNLGALALSYRDYEGAERVLARASALEPNSAQSALAYAWALDGQKGRDPKKGVQAGEVFERVLALRAEQPEALCGAAWAYAADRSGWDRSLSFFERCRKVTSNPQDQQQIDLKVKGLLALQRSGAQVPAPAEKPKAAPKDSALLDKVSDDAAKQDAASDQSGK